MASGMEVVELDTTPSPGDEGVQNVLRNLEDHLQMRGTISMIESVGNYMYVSTNAAARDAKQLVKVQDCLFNIIKLNDACSLMMQSFQSGANNILEKLKVAYLYLLDGFPDFAMTDIEAISKDVGSMQSAVDKHLKSEKKTAEKITDTHAVVKKELSNLQRKVQVLEEQEEEKKEVVGRLEDSIHGMPRDGSGVGDKPATEDQPVESKTRISKFYVLMLLLVGTKYWYYWKVCSDMDKFDSKACLQAHAMIGFVVLLVLFLKWIVDSECRNKGNVLLACAVSGLLFGPISLQQEGGLQIKNIANLFPSYGSAMFVGAYSGEQVNQGREPKPYHEALDESDGPREGKAVDTTPSKQNEFNQKLHKEPSKDSGSGGTEDIWFGSDGSKSHSTRAEVNMATQTKASDSETDKTGRVPATAAETSGNEDDTTYGTCSVWDIFHVYVCFPPGARTLVFEQQFKRESRKPSVDDTPVKLSLSNPWYLLLLYQVILIVLFGFLMWKNLENSFSGVIVLIRYLGGSVCIWLVVTYEVRTSSILDYLGPVKCSPPDPWCLLLQSPAFIMVLYGLYMRKNLDDSFSGPIVLILHLVGSVCIWLDVTYEVRTNTILDYLGHSEIADLGLVSSGSFALVISMCIVRARCKVSVQVNYSLLPTSTGRPTREDLSIAKDELSDIQINLKSAKGLLESTELTDLLFERSLPYLLGIENILSKSIMLVEKWYKECKDVVEPNMGRNIDRAAGIDENERQRYWNSLQFKQEVVGYYCRWKALQVYCEENRKFIRATRQRIEGWYTENLHPREAVAKSWRQAAELNDPDVQAFLRDHGRGGIIALVPFTYQSAGHASVEEYGII